VCFYQSPGINHQFSSQPNKTEIEIQLPTGNVMGDSTLEKKINEE
jgi:hypothetical protein